MCIRFKCPKCRATVTAPDAYAGQHAKCPNCYGQISVPPGNVQPAGSPPALIAPRPQQETQEAIAPPSPSSVHAVTLCPFCRETVAGDARKCKHCSEFLQQPVYSTVDFCDDSQILCIAQAQQGMHWSLLLSILGSFVFVSLAVAHADGVSGNKQLPGLWLFLLAWLPISHWFMYSTCSLLSRLGASMPVLWLLGINVPILGIVLVLILSSRASNVIRNGGFGVGFMGADIPSIKSQIALLTTAQN